MRRRARRLGHAGGDTRYDRGWFWLTVALAAAPVAPLVAPLSGSSLELPSAIVSRVAIGVTVANVVVAVAREASSGPQRSRIALLFMASVVVAAGVAAHIIEERSNLFFTADLLYGITASMLVLSALCSVLRTMSTVRQLRIVADGRSWYSAYRPLSDTLISAAAWMMGIFWAIVVTGLHYLAAVFLVLTGGLLAVAFVLRLAETVSPTVRHPPRA